MKQILFLVLAVILFFSMTACTSPSTSVQIDTSNTTIQLSLPGPNPLVNQPDGQGRVARAVAGLWHGLIVPVTLILSFSGLDESPTLAIVRVDNRICLISSFVMAMLL